MKKIVFLLLICFTITPKIVQASSIEVYTFTDYEIRLESFWENGAFGYNIDKIGKDPFSRQLLYEDSQFYIHGIKEIDHNHVLYGYIHQPGGDTYYEGFVVVLNQNGEEILKRTYDFGFEEDINGIEVMDGALGIVISMVQENEQEQYDFVQSKVLLVDFTYETMKEFDIFHEIKNISSTDNLLLLDFDNDGTNDLGIQNTSQILYADEPLSIQSDNVFNNTTYIPFLNTAFLNNQLVENGVLITSPGNYSLKYNNVLYTFTVVPEVMGVEDNGVYTKTVTPLFYAKNAYLNGELFVSGENISEVGHYDLVIKGVGNYEKTLSFTILSDIKGIVNNGIYNTPVDLSFSGNGYLNNVFINSPYTISKPGDYLLTIKGKNNYTEQYSFTINDMDNSFSFVNFLKQYDLYILAITLISGFVVLKKK
jgi:hypothetical protein